MSKELTGHWKTTCDSNFLGSHDLYENGKYKEVVLTISKVVEDDVMDTKTNKSIKKTTIHFVEKNVKPMILNSTNKLAISKVSGTPEMEKWKNVKITIYVQEKIKAFGELHDALRIHKIAPRNSVAKEMCEVCGNEMDQKIFFQTKNAYGTGICSAECKSKLKLEKGDE